MATLAELNVVIGAQVDGFEAAVAKVQKGIGRVGDAAKEAGEALTKYVTLPIAGLGVAALSASGKIDALSRGLQAVTQQQLGEQGVTGLKGIEQAAADTQKRLVELRQVAALPGLGFAEAVQGDIRLRAVGISAKLSKDALLAFGNAIATTGGGKSELDRVTVQLGQLSAKGKVLAQDLRPIIEAAPAVATALKKLYGTVDSETISESLAKQGKSSTDFIEVLTAELGQMPKVTGGLKNAFENLQDSAEIGLAGLGDALNKSFDIEGSLGKIGDYISEVADRFANLSPALQRTIFVFAGVAAAIGPVLVVLGALGAATPSVVAGFALVRTAVLASSGAFTALLSPAGAIIAVLATLAAVFYAGATANERLYQSFREQSAATQKLTSDISPLLDRYDELKSKTTLSADEQSELKGIIEKVTAVLPDAGKGFDDYGNAIELSTKKARAFIAGNQALDKTIALQSLPAQVAKLKELQAEYDRTAKRRDEVTSKGTFNGVSVESLGTKFLLEFRDKVAETTTALAEQRQRVAELRSTIKGLGAAYEEVNGLNSVGIAGAAGTEIGLLEGLREKLKAVKEQREKETEVADITADNQRIKSLEAQIAALEGVDKKSKKAQDALANLAKELRGNGQLSTALGSDYDFLQERQRILESGLKTLVLAGVSPASAAFRRYAAELKNLNFILRDNDLLQSRQVENTKKLDDTPAFKLNVPEAPKLPAELAPLTTPIKLPPVIFSEYTNSLGEITEAGRAALQAQEDFNTNTQALIDAFPVEGLASIGQAIGQSLGEGGNVLEGAGKALLKVLADFGQKYGAQLIALGIADIATGIFVAKGAAEIAAGTGLIAASAALGAFGGAGGGGGSGGGISSAPSSSFSPSRAAQTGQQSIRVEVSGTLKASGADLQAALRTRGYRNERTS